MIIYIKENMEKAQLAEQYKNELAQSRISIMLSQIQPHFLYNMLTSIAQLCDINPKLAKQTTVDFSKYLRNNIDSLTIAEPISFEKELSHIKTYLSLEKIRFDDELCIIYDIQVNKFCVPLLTVQPIVENAVKHGVGDKKGGGTVTISTYETEADFVIIISDDGVGFDQNAIKDDDRTHIGIKNVKSRLLVQYNATLTIESKINIGTDVTIRIPKEDVHNERNACR